MKKNHLDFEKLINHPLFELAKVELIREGKIFLKKEGKKLVYDIKTPNIFFVDILEKMLEIINVAHKQGQKEILDDYIKERL